MMSKPRGLCLIINNKNFEHPDPQKRHQMLRRGSEYDIENLNVLFQTLEFEVHIKNDLRKLEMFGELQKFSQKPTSAHCWCRWQGIPVNHLLPSDLGP